MSAKLFDKDLKKSCLWCVYGRQSNYTNEIFCKKHGVTAAEDYCRKYKYDPLKRTPEKAVIDRDYTRDDFLL